VNPKTPYFLISEVSLLKNLRRIRQLQEKSGAKVVLALKCFSTWGVFPIIRAFVDGTTSSSVFEARLGHETIGGETHAYSVAFSAEDVEEADAFSDKFIFNSARQLLEHSPRLKRCKSVGLRVNPGGGHAADPRYDPSLPTSRLGVRKSGLTEELIQRIDGVMFHYNCENADAEDFIESLDRISAEFGEQLLDRLDWVSLGGGVRFTTDGYPLGRVADALKGFAERHSIQVYLEPGEALITETTDLVSAILDIVETEGIPTAILDSATEAHRLDTLIFDEPAEIREADPTGEFEYVIGSSSCLAGDIFGRARFAKPLEIGQQLHVLDSAGYTMVKLNWFNGLRMPEVWVERENGAKVRINEFGYADFKRSLSLRSIDGEG
jgi:carboxynorspermidine decarboxylase